MSKYFEQWQQHILDVINEDVDVARISFLCDILLQNDLVTARQLRRIADPALWEGADGLSAGCLFICRVMFVLFCLYQVS